MRGRRGQLGCEIALVIIKIGVGLVMIEKVIVPLLAYLSRVDVDSGIGFVYLPVQGNFFSLEIYRFLVVCTNPFGR